MFCPFPDHKETQPSFTIFPQRNTFHCFGCKKTGSIARLMRLMGDVVPPELAAEEQRMRQASDINFNPELKNTLLAVRNEITEIRKLRKEFGNHPNLNARVYAAIQNLEGVQIEIPSRKRHTYPYKK